MNQAIIFLAIFTITTIVGYFIINLFDISRLRKFELLISYMGSMSALLLIYNIYITIQSENWNEKNRLAYNTLENINRSFLMPQKELLDVYPDGYFLYASMNQDTDLSNDEPKKFDPIKRKQVEVYASLRIFQAMEDFLSVGSFDLTGTNIWVNNFLMWMQSPILQQYWNILAFNYSPDTRAFVDTIIKKADELIEQRKSKKHLTPEDYDTISKNIRLKNP